MLATLSHDVVTGPGWVFEEKYDGIRALAYRRGSDVRIVSRNDLDLTAGFPHVAAAVAGLPRDLVLDGELVVFDSDGVSRFQLLQRRGGDVRPVRRVDRRGQAPPAGLPRPADRQVPERVPLGRS